MRCSTLSPVQYSAVALEAAARCATNMGIWRYNEVWCVTNSGICQYKSITASYVEIRCVMNIGDRQGGSERENGEEGEGAGVN